MSLAKQLSASLEDNLKAIYDTISEKGAIRSKDIAEWFDIKAGSVTTALKTLAKTGHLNYKPYGIITLTPMGLEHARKVRGKHETLTNFFVDILGADVAMAEAGASCIGSEPGICNQNRKYGWIRKPFNRFINRSAGFRLQE